MGLRFRKSVTLCKGVKLNIGKTGMSVSVGGKGYHKTINTKGQVTTSMGIPGTGIYYTDTKNLRGNNGVRVSTNANVNQYEQREYREFQEDYTINSAVENYFNPGAQTMSEGAKQRELPHAIVDDNQEIIEKSNIPLTMDDIKQIYSRCDEVIDWTELLVSTSAEDVFMETETWKFLKSISRKVLSGDIDAYLETIEKMRPVDDLLEYGSDFEFGTDNPNTMEVEFRINEQNMLPEVKTIGIEAYEQIFFEYVSASVIRVARDLFALLPVKFVIVYAKKEDNIVMKAKFDKNEVQKIDFRNERGTDIISKFLVEE